ncbi:hypothetical protein QVD99_003592 [Batrachochytrium dendrobatidis]|nr:hypothetical protein QVD99_003592 [Batrachochytrium dendrobatidis]
MPNRRKKLPIQPLQNLTTSSAGFSSGEVATFSEAHVLAESDTGHGREFPNTLVGSISSKRPATDSYSAESTSVEPECSRDARFSDSTLASSSPHAFKYPRLTTAGRARHSVDIATASRGESSHDDCTRRTNIQPFSLGSSSSNNITTSAPITTAALVSLDSSQKDCIASRLSQSNLLSTPVSESRPALERIVDSPTVRNQARYHLRIPTDSISSPDTPPQIGRGTRPLSGRSTPLFQENRTTRPNVFRASASGRGLRTGVLTSERPTTSDTNHSRNMPRNSSTSDSYRISTPRTRGTSRSVSTHPSLRASTSRSPISIDLTLGSPTTSTHPSIDADEEFARRLQEEEYNAIQSINIQHIHRHMMGLVSDDREAILGEEAPYQASTEESEVNSDEEDEGTMHEFLERAHHGYYHWNDEDEHDEDEDEEHGDEIEYADSDALETSVFGYGRYHHTPTRHHPIDPVQSASFRRGDATRNTWRVTPSWMANFGLGLASSPRNYLRDDELDVSYEGLLALSSRIGEVVQKGTPTEIIMSIPSHLYHVSKHLPSGGDIPKCAICLEDYIEGDVIKCLPGCNHELHGSCVSNWLLQSKQCPICRFDITKSQ